MRICRTIMQGDAYPLTFNLVDRDFVPVDVSEIESLELVIGSIQATYPGGGISYNEMIEKWVLTLTQEQTLHAASGWFPIQYRIKNDDAYVQGELADSIVEIIKAQRAEVL